MLEAPSIAELIHLSVELLPVEELGVVSVRTYANDGDTVTLTWDTFACSFTVSWRSADVEVLQIYRELATKVSISENRGVTDLTCWTSVEGLGGHLWVRVADRVSVSDVLLSR